MTEWFLGLAFLLGIFKILNMSSLAVAPDIYIKDRSSAFVKSILAACPIFLEPYIPTLIWGKSGHIQTIVYGKMGRVQYPDLKGDRHEHIMSDGATSTFDVYHPLSEHQAGGDYSLLVCPGIANCSESPYIRTLVHMAQRGGYRVAVLNHLGALRDVELTSPRIFDYGSTQEFHHMVEDMRKIYPNSSFLAVGFSMGANIITKYLGEHPDHQKHFICGMSLCQGYDVIQVRPQIMSFFLPRLYVYAMTENIKKMLQRHRNILFSASAQEKYGSFNMEKIFSSTSLEALDEAYSCKRLGFKSLDDYYQSCSSGNYLNNVTIPMFILNALDDPLVPPCLHTIPREFAESRDNCLYVVTRHGGHLGYFEGGYFTPSPITWIDRAVLEFANAVVTMEEKQQ
ncbi:monoacylglycerol lipase ABHD2-like [Haliotis rufescens]|uniref:monoacylglycerol lipase ABHD2-like n=1 Tax=Haliotis rufescens TaxID=6454 RepID=UPI001EB0ADBE|nr:monoacylglycerol lipase ABHD2-like [Haliotis rufescens]